MVNGRRDISPRGATAKRRAGQSSRRRRRAAAQIAAVLVVAGGITGFVATRGSSVKAAPSSVAVGSRGPRSRRGRDHSH